MNIVCRHDHLIEEGCRLCLGPEDWHIEPTTATAAITEASS